MSSSKEIDIEVIFKYLLHWKNILANKWKYIMIIGMLGGILGFSYAKLKRKKYIAELTFALEEKSSSTGSLGAYAGIASQFGIDLGSGGSSVFSGDNILELMKSRMILKKTLLNKVNINNKETRLLDRYVQSLKIQSKLVNSQDQIISLDFNNDADLTIEQDSVLAIIIKDIKDNRLEVSKIDKKLNIIKVNLKFQDQIFAKFFTEKLVENVSAFYIQTKTKKAKANVELLQRKTDSVRTKLYEEMYDAASSQDQNLNVIKARAKVPGVKKQINIQLLSAMYTELVKNLELSKLTLSKEEPFIQIIDSPELPLLELKPNSILFSIVGLILSGLFAVSIFTVIGIRRFNKIVV